MHKIINLAIKLPNAEFCLLKSPKHLLIHSAPFEKENGEVPQKKVK